MFHIVWVLCWFIASIEWAIGYRRLDDKFNQLANDTFNAVKDGCSPDASAATKSLSIDVQAAIGDVRARVCVWCVCVRVCVGWGGEAVLSLPLENTSALDISEVCLLRELVYALGVTGWCLINTVK